ncbi:MAG TPA: glycosyltransferase family 2 protein, partial [Longilinea sp.]|nr:glycosyltransferase family 2 protein [Longilinea sp.]
MPTNSQAYHPEIVHPDIDQQLKELAQNLANSQTVVSSHSNELFLLNQLGIWKTAFQNAHAVFKEVSPKDALISHAGEWLLDNYYFIKQTFRQIEEALPVSFYHQLPKLSTTDVEGYPRIFGLAHEWISFSSNQIDLDQLVIFLHYYQQITPLSIGELWALPIMLRIGILERLVEAVTEITGLVIPKSLNQIQNQSSSPALLKETIVANCFSSLRLLSTTDWNEFFEQSSRVEQVLRTDPAGIYSQMDFDTRNNYRSVIEELARFSSFSEEQVALTAIGLAGSAGNATPNRKFHVGYFLIDAGRSTLEGQINFKPRLRDRIRRVLLSSPTALYLGSIASLSVLFFVGFLLYAFFSGNSLTQFILAGLLGLGLALEAAITMVNWNVTHRIKPKSLPRMDFSESIPPGNRTMIVVPTLLESTAELNHLLQELELYYLSNPDSQLTYALLTDFGDAPTQVMPQDEQLLSLARVGIDALNKKYSQAAPFYLFHRQREWNPSEGVWMGWERKRGKLAEFNRLLLNQGDTSYTTQVGEASILSDIKYVITLDADTSLPQGSANRLIATLAHPLNHAEFSADGRSVTAGYTVLQPRVAIKPTSANRSLFSQIYSGNVGFDLYSFAVSDVYQDLFGEGSYVGKGIYDVAAFERSLVGQVRENTLLSHDLFEGIYGRAALVTDIVLYEEYPSRYLEYTRRLRRWIRGDWQLLPWLFPIVRTDEGFVRNRLSLINIWKIFDNLRRSLLPPTVVALLVVGWLYLSGLPLIWTLLALLPSILPVVLQTAQHTKQNINLLSLKQFFEPLLPQFIRWAFSILFLPYEALLIFGAIFTTLIRLFIARKNLLQWTTAANSKRSFGLNEYYSAWREMAPALILTVLLGAGIAIFNPHVFWVASPLLIIWLIAPHIAFRISQRISHATAPLTEPQRRQVHRLARRTWAYFEQFAGPNDHWLPPDHFQESPGGNVAHYTTPTNIGLFLVSVLSAYDFGYIGLFELAVRLRSTFETMGQLEHYRGHLLNWYDSQTLAALPPRYVSTVDSGNLAASLITLKQGCLALPNEPVLGSKQWQGLLAIIDILSEVLKKIEKNNPDVLFESFEIELTRIYERVNSIQNKPSEWALTLSWLQGEGWQRVSYRLMELLESHPDLQSDSLTELQLYLNLFHHHLQDIHRSLDSFAPWLTCLDKTPTTLTKMVLWSDFYNSLPVEMPNLGQVSEVYDSIKRKLHDLQGQAQENADLEWCQHLDEKLTSARMMVTPLLISFRD